MVFLKTCFYFLACECYVNGTDICDNMNGNCHCSVGYMGETCRNCSEGFFNSGSIENPICQGKFGYNLNFFLWLYHKILANFYLIGCDCYIQGTQDCNGVSGGCTCKNGYEGDNCDQCEGGFYNATSELRIFGNNNPTTCIGKI